jgi:hypothetical protein
MPLAEVGDIGRNMTGAQKSDAETLIAAAEAWIRAPHRRPDIQDDDPTGKRVVIEVVRAAMAVPVEFAGHTSYSKTVGPRSKSGTVDTPAGALVFTKEHERLLGITAAASGSFGDPPGYRYPPPGAVMP